MDHLCCFCLCLLSFRACLIIVALWLPAGKGLTSWLSFVVFGSGSVAFQLVHPGSGVVLDLSIPDLCTIS